MSFDWSHYIRLAENLEHEAGNLADREACLRSAISRAYYGAFGLAREFAVRHDALSLTQRAEDHRKVIWHFRSDPQTKRRWIGINLDRLRKARNHADYDNSFSGLDKETRKSLQRARRIKNDLAQT